MIYWYIQLIYYTCKIKYQNCQPIVDKIQRGENVIFCSWHGRLLLMPLFFRIDRQLTKHPNLFYLTSPHLDSIWMTKVAEKFHLEIVFGSSIKVGRNKYNHAVSALRIILKNLRLGKNFYITPDVITDKHQDVAFQVRGAILDLARLTGRPVVPISFSASHQKILNTRDHFCLPLPFSTVTIACGNPITVGANENPDSHKKELELSLNQLMLNYDTHS